MVQWTLIVSVNQSLVLQGETANDFTDTQGPIIGLTFSLVYSGPVPAVKVLSSAYRIWSEILDSLE